MSPSDRKARVEALAEAGDWQQALQLAAQDQEQRGPPDWLLQAAVDAVAPLAVPAGRAGLKGLEPAQDAQSRRQLTQQWCLQIAGADAMAQTALRHLRECLSMAECP